MVPSLYLSPLVLRFLMMTSPTIGLSLSAPVHLVHVYGLPLSSLGSLRPTILPKSLPSSS